MKIRTSVKAGGTLNHNEALVQSRATGRGFKVRTSVKAGWGGNNHNETLVRSTAAAKR